MNLDARGLNAAERTTAQFVGDNIDTGEAARLIVAAYLEAVEPLPAPEPVEGSITYTATVRCASVDGYGDDDFWVNRPGFLQIGFDREDDARIRLTEGQRYRVTLTPVMEGE